MKPVKRFKNFLAVAPYDFRDKIIEYWIENEGLTKEQAISAYGEGLDDLCAALISNVREYKPDLGYKGEENGTLCFEIEDDNFCIPIKILTVIE